MVWKESGCVTLRVFGCAAYSNVPDAERKKLDKKATKLRFVRYSGNKKGSRLVNEQTRKLVVRCHVEFNELDVCSGKEVQENREAEKYCIQNDDSSDEQKYYPKDLKWFEVDLKWFEKHSVDNAKRGRQCTMDMINMLRPCMIRCNILHFMQLWSRLRLRKHNLVIKQRSGRLRQILNTNH